MRDDFIGQVESLTMGDVSADLSLFMGAVIDERAFAKHAAALERARAAESVRVLAGGWADDSEGYFVQPTVLECTDPTDELFTTEYFGPILAVHVYDDTAYPEMLAQAADVTRYALTGAIVAQDRAAIVEADEILRFSAGNFYINDKPTGAVVGPAAVRRGQGQRHQRQGGVDLQPDPVGERPRHQGAVRPADRLPLPAHGIAKYGYPGRSAASRPACGSQIGEPIALTGRSPRPAEDGVHGR